MKSMVRPRSACRSQQVEDLRLDGDVERGDRLVADDELRLEGERAGDADALALAAGEFVRVAVMWSGVEARPARQSAATRSRPLGALADADGSSSGSRDGVADRSCAD